MLPRWAIGASTESPFEHPALMSHTAILAEMPATFLMRDSPVWLQVGVEDVDDPRDHLAQALGAIRLSPQDGPR